MNQKQIKITSLGILESVWLERFYFWQKPKVAKILAKIRTSCGFIFLDSSRYCAQNDNRIGLPRATSRTRNDKNKRESVNRRGVR